MSRMTIASMLLLGGCFAPSQYMPAGSQASSSTTDEAPTTGEVPTAGTDTEPPGSTGATAATSSGAVTSLGTTDGTGTTDGDTMATASSSSGGSGGMIVPARCGDGLPSPGHYCFDDPVSIPNSEFVVCIGGGDINGDANPDVIVGGEGAGVFVSLGTDDGGFGPPLEEGSAAPSACALISSPAGDSFLVGLADGFGAWSITPGQTLVSATTEFMNSSYARIIDVADFDGDGFNDIIAGLGPFGASDSVRPILANEDYTQLTPVAGPSVGDSLIDMGVGDANGDGRSDIIWTSTSSTSPPRIGLTLGTATMMAPTTLNSVYESPQGTEIEAVALADVGGSEDLDLAFIQDGVVYIALGNGALSFSDPVELELSGSPFALVAAELDGQHQRELLVAHGNSTQLSAVGNIEGETVIQTIPLGAFPALVEARDINADGASDILVARPDLGPVLVVQSRI